VARQSGLKSSDRLRRLFQQAYGVTPADYRNDKSSPLVRTHDAKPAPTTLPERFARLSHLHAKIIVSLPMLTNASVPVEILSRLGARRSRPIAGSSSKPVTFRSTG
jgi:hypothetical protein